MNNIKLDEILLLIISVLFLCFFVAFLKEKIGRKFGLTIRQRRCLEKQAGYPMSFIEHLEVAFGGSY